MGTMGNIANSEITGFCRGVISRYRETWPPAEELLAEEFVKWFTLKPFQTREALIRLCFSKGVHLSFSPLPRDLHGFNCSYQGTRQILISEGEQAPFADLHTFLHEFRERLEGVGSAFADKSETMSLL